MAELDKVGLKEEHLARNGGTGNSTEQLLTAARRTLDWINSRLEYLPSSVDPDTLLLELSERHSPKSGIDAKKQWVEITRHALGKSCGEIVTAAEILETQKRELANIPDNTPELQDIVEILLFRT